MSTKSARDYRHLAGFASLDDGRELRVCGDGVVRRVPPEVSRDRTPPLVVRETGVDGRVRTDIFVGLFCTVSRFPGLHGFGERVLRARLETPRSVLTDETLKVVLRTLVWLPTLSLLLVLRLDQRRRKSTMDPPMGMGGLIDGTCETSFSGDGSGDATVDRAFPGGRS